VAERDRGGECSARRNDPRRQTHTQRFLRAHWPPGEDEVEGLPLADEPGQAHGAAVDEGHTPPPAEHPEHRVVGHHPQVAPERELEATGDGVPLDRGDHRLGEDAPRRSHRAVAIDRDPVHAGAARLGHRLEVGTGAERAARAREHHHREVGVALEPLARVDQRVRGRAIDRVAGLGPIDGDDRDGTVGFEVHAHASPLSIGVSTR
jgi:hypothetical protein